MGPGHTLHESQWKLGWANAIRMELYPSIWLRKKSLLHLRTLASAKKARLTNKPLKAEANFARLSKMIEGTYTYILTHILPYDRLIPLRHVSNLLDNFVLIQGQHCQAESPLFDACLRIEQHTKHKS